MIFVIDDDEIMAECIARAVKRETNIFSNSLEAMHALNEEVPEMIFLDILLDGPDGFTFLNELVSYTDTVKIPIIIVSSLNFAGKDLSMYGVVGTLNKDSMKPDDIKKYVEQYAK